MYHLHIGSIQMRTFFKHLGYCQMRNLQQICCSLCQLMCGADKDIMHVFKIFVRHLDALHPSCAALWPQSYGA